MVKMKKGLKDVCILSLLFLIADQMIKIILNNRMIVNQTVVIIKNFFSITLVHNEGAAFSILIGSRYLFIIIGIIAIIGILYYIKKTDFIDNVDLFIYSLFIAGVLGNLVDRLVYGYVIDYLSFNFGNFFFPIFNFADIYIVLSVIMYMIRVIKGDLWK